MPSARGDREAGDRPCTTMVTLRKTKSLSIILSHLLGTSCHATTLSFNINTLHFSSSYACNHTMTLGGVIWPLPSLLENILSFFFPFTSSIQSCCSASSGVILSARVPLQTTTQKVQELSIGCLDSCGEVLGSRSTLTTLRVRDTTGISLRICICNRIELLNLCIANN